MVLILCISNTNSRTPYNTAVFTQRWRDSCFATAGTTQKHQATCSLVLSNYEWKRQQLTKEWGFISVRVKRSLGRLWRMAEALHKPGVRGLDSRLSLQFLIYTILTVALWPWGRLGLWHKRVPGILPWGVTVADRMADSLTTFMCRLSRKSRSLNTNSHMPCRAPATLRHCRVLRESAW
jgi:hypothetical protein